MPIILEIIYVKNEREVKMGSVTFSQVRSMHAVEGVGRASEERRVCEVKSHEMTRKLTRIAENLKDLQIAETRIDWQRARLRSIL